MTVFTVITYPCTPGADSDCQWSEVTHYGQETGIVHCLTHGGTGTIDRYPPTEVPR